MWCTICLSVRETYPCLPIALIVVYFVLVVLVPLPLLFQVFDELIVQLIALRSELLESYFEGLDCLFLVIFVSWYVELL